MKRLFLALVLVSFAHSAFAYEFRLQFTPQAGAQGLTVAGYQFASSTVVGNCSYYTYSACSGRGCHSVRTNHYNTCTWDLFGNLVSMVPGAPTAPTPLYESGTEVVYAKSQGIANSCVPGGNSTTGSDTRGFGFVDTPSAHYSWQTLNGGYAVIPDTVDDVGATLISDGDCNLVIDSATVKAQIYGTITPSSGSASIASNSCGGSVTPNSTCTVTVAYDPTTISCTGSPYGYAYTGIDLSLVTNAGANTDFTQRFTVTGVPVCND